jgi:type II secretory pathway component GspD/PulD (secretin)
MRRAKIRNHLSEGERPMSQSHGGLIHAAAISSLLLFGLLGQEATPAQIFLGEAETNPKGKAAAKADFVLTVKDNVISLKAKDASLREILEEIGRRTSIEVFALLPQQEKITTEFEKVPLEEAIERLIRNYPHLLVSQEGDGKITRIVALQKNADTVSSKPVMTGPEIKKEETPTKFESRMKEEAVRKESPPQKPFSFQFDPSQQGVNPR